MKRATQAQDSSAQWSHSLFRLSRRSFLTVSGSAFLGLTLPSGGVRAGPGDKFGVKPTIMCWLEGGPPGFDMFMPFAPKVTSELRGPLKGIPTSVSGVYFTERFPMLAARMHKFALIRSLQSRSSDHVTATRNHLKGTERKTFGIRWGERAAMGGVPYALVDIPGQFRPDPPHDQNAAFYAQWKRAANWEQQVTEDQQRLSGFDQDLVGPGRFAPPEVNVDPKLPERRRLLDALDRSALSGEPVSKWQKNRELAFTLLSGGGEFFKAFDPPKDERAAYERDLERYGGESRVGQALLLARRMVERGAGFVTVHNGLRGGWDMHSNLYERMIPLAAELDRGIAALIDEIHDGRIDCTLILMGEFGRTPKINGSGGRDHWSEANFALLAGGDFLPGAVHGSIDNQGAVKDGAVDPELFVRTLIHGAGGEKLLVPNETRVRQVLR